MDIKDLKEHLDKTVDEVKELTARQSEEIEKQGKATEETGQKLDEATERMDEIKGEVSTILEEKKEMDARMIEMEKQLNRKHGSPDEEAESLGRLLVESKQFKQAVEIGSRNVEPVQSEKSLKDLTSTTGSAGALDQPQRRREIFRDPQDRGFFIRDLIPTVPTQDGSVEIVVEKSFTNAAAPQAATGTGTGLGEGEFESKPKSNLVYELKDVKIRTMAHWIAASRQILDDAPRLRAEVDGRLTYGLLLLSDDQLLFGDGTGQNLEGIMVNANVSDLGELDSGTASDDVPNEMIDHIRRAVTKCQINEYRNINGLVLHPNDWEQIELAKGSDKRYIWVSVVTGGQERLWRVPVVVTNAQNENEFVLGDWQMGATLYDRQQVSVRVSESHADFFIQNALAILAEERIGLGVHRPLAFTKGKFTVASA